MMIAETVNNDASKNPENWNGKKLNKWFQKGEWRLEWNIIPDESINKAELAIQFFKNRELWEKAFNFLKTSDLKKIDTGKYELQGKDMYIIVDEYITRNEEDSAFEAHRRYIDIQYIVEGEEKIGISALGNTKEITHYDNLKDTIFLTAKHNNYRIASHEKFLYFSLKMPTVLV